MDNYLQTIIIEDLKTRDYIEHLKANDKLIKERNTIIRNEIIAYLKQKLELQAKNRLISESNSNELWHSLLTQ